jgi:hypothetical protein
MPEFSFVVSFVWSDHTAHAQQEFLHVDANVGREGEPGSVAKENAGDRMFDPPYGGSKIANSVRVGTVWPEDSGDVTPGSGAVQGENSEHALLSETDRYLLASVTQHPAVEKSQLPKPRK